MISLRKTKRTIWNVGIGADVVNGQIAKDFEIKRAVCVDGQGCLTFDCVSLFI